MRGKMRLLINLAILAALALSFNYIQFLSNNLQRSKNELAEISHIRYGLFNLEAWKEKVSSLLVKKIAELEITNDNRLEMKRVIEISLQTLLNELSDFLEENKNVGNFFEKFTKKIVYGIAFDKSVFEQEIPRFAEEILNTVETPETKEKLKDYVKAKLLRLLDETHMEFDQSLLEVILEKNNCVTVEECKYLLEARIDDFQKRLNLFSFTLLFILATLFLIVRFNRWASRHLRFSAISLLLFFISVGISLPMLTIDVRMLEFDFNLVGESIAFSDQVLYFQSKSIIQVIDLLLSDEQFYSVLCGLLILSFSVLFPVSKIICLMYEEITHKSTKLTSFIINKTGKWSMADVMVVSIFLTYIGINSFLDDLLEMTNSTSLNMTFTPNASYSSLESGLLFFLLFVIFSMLVKPRCSFQTGNDPDMGSDINP